MNLLENYITKIHSVKPCEEEWTKEKEFEDVEFVIVDITTNCYGREERIERIFRKDCWEDVESKGYFMA